MTIIYFAGAQSKEKKLLDIGVRNILVSYMYKQSIDFDLLKQFDHVFLDSGAFTLMEHKNTQEEIDKYVEEYAEWLKTHHQFFHQIAEVDVGSYEKMQAQRKLLRSLVGDKLVEVYHTEYKNEKIIDEIASDGTYIAWGGSQEEDIKTFNTAYNLNKRLNIFFTKATKNKIHGFGITSPTVLRKFNFYSVDSTTWSVGARYGVTFIFVNGKMFNFLKGDKKQRARFRFQIERWGLDFKKIMEDDNEEVTKLNIKSWLEYQEWLNSYWSNKEISQTALIPVESGYMHSRANGLKHGKFAKTLTTLYCDTCYIKERCEEFKAESLCGKHKFFQKMNIGRDVDKVRETLKTMLDSLAERISRATHFEAVDGGVIDKNIDSMKSNYARIAQIVWQIEHPTQVNVYEQTNVMNLQKIDIIKQVLDSMPDKTEAELEALLREKMKKKAQQVV